MAAGDTRGVGRGRSGRDRVLDAAYGLFSRADVRAIGVDAITAEAGVAKMTLYRTFVSKNELALAFPALREERWTNGWVQDEVRRRADGPAEQLLAIFAEWFAHEDFEGSRFIASLLEFDDRAEPVRQACVTHLANIRAFLCELAAAAGVEDPHRFAAQWHILMKGAIVARHEGDADAALKAREMGLLLLAREGIVESNRDLVGGSWAGGCGGRPRDCRQRLGFRLVASAPNRASWWAAVSTRCVSSSGSLSPRRSEPWTSSSPASGGPGLVEHDG